MLKKPKSGSVSTATTSSGPRHQADINLVLQVPEFADRYAVTPRTVWTWLQCGLPHLKISTKRTRIPVREGDEWVAQNFYRQRQR